MSSTEASNRNGFICTAQGCFKIQHVAKQQVVKQVVQQKVVQQKVVQQVAHAYCAPQQVAYAAPYYVKQQIAIVAVEDHNYDVQLAGSYVRARNRQQAIADEVRGVRAELAALRAQLAQGGTAPPAAPPIPPAIPPDEGTVSTDPPGANTTPLDPDMERVAVGLLTERCAKCHSGPTSKGLFKLFEEDGLTMVPITPGKLILIDQVTYANEMPKAPTPKLTADEYNRLRAWIQSYSQGIRQVARKSDTE